MDNKFRSLSLKASSDLMDIDSSSYGVLDTDGDIMMDESISNSPSLPLRYHNYFHRIQKVNQTRSSNELSTLEDMRNRIEEIDHTIHDLNNQQISHVEKIVDPVQAVDLQQKSDDTSTATNDEEENVNSKSLIRSIMSPTMLGARVAYNSSSPASSPLKPLKDDEDEIVEYSTADAVVEETPNEITTSIQKNPQVQFQLHHHHYYYPVNQDNNNTTTLQQQQQQQLQKIDRNGDIFLPLPSKFHDTPYYISTYLQILLNFLVSSYAFYIVYQLIRGMKSDIDLKLKEKIQDLIIEVDSCRTHFEENKCFKDTITPVIRDQCAEWEKCMYKDPFSTSGKLVITLQLIGMILNSLIEPISLKSCFVLLMVVCCLFALNFSFGFLRLKIYFRDKNDNKKLI